MIAAGVMLAGWRKRGAYRDSGVAENRSREQAWAAMSLARPKSLHAASFHNPCGKKIGFGLVCSITACGCRSSRGPFRRDLLFV